MYIKPNKVTDITYLCKPFHSSLFEHEVYVLPFLRCYQSAPVVGFCFPPAGFLRTTIRSVKSGKNSNLNKRLFQPHPVVKNVMSNSEPK